MIYDIIFIPFCAEVITIIIQNDYFAVTNVLLCNRRKAKEDYRIQVKARKGHGLTLVLSGKLKFTFADQNFTAASGDIIMQQQNDSYYLESLSDETEYIVITYLCSPANIITQLTSDSRIFRSKNISRYIDRFNKAVSINQAAGICSKPLLNAITQQLLCNIIREKVSLEETAPRTPAIAVKQYIDAHAFSPITIEEISQQVGFSCSYVRQAFKQEYGIPPIRYLNTVRIEYAKELLSSGLYTMEEIATACGFNNVYYFSRVFKEYTGSSPGRY